MADGKSNFIIPLDFDPPKMKFSQRSNAGNFTHIKQSFYEVEKKDEEAPF